MRRFSLPSLILLLALIAGCSSNPTQPYVKGTLSGTVALMDESDKDVPLPEFSGATVTIVGTSRTAITDSMGHWSIKDLPAGTYDISITKPGFIPLDWRSFIFVGGGEAFLGGHDSVQKLYLTPPFTIPEFSVTWIDTNTLKVSGTISSPPAEGRNHVVTVLMGRRSPLTVPENHALVVMMLYANSQQTTFEQYYTRGLMHTLFAPGTYYAVALPGSGQVVTRIDPVTGSEYINRNVTPASNEVSFEVQ